MNVKDKNRRWTPVTTDQMERLKAASLKRQAKDEELKKIVANLEKRSRNKGVIKISEILDDPDQKSEDEEDEESEDDKELGPRVKEGIQVLADLIEMSR